MKKFVLFALASVTCSFTFAATVNFSLNAAVDVDRDLVGTELEANRLVLWVVDRASGGNFAGLQSASNFSVDEGDVLEVGQFFGSFEIVGYAPSSGLGEIGSGFSIETEDSPLNPDLAVSAGDRFAMMWFPSLAYNMSGSTVLTAANDGIAFGFASVTGQTFGNWVLPAGPASLQFLASPSSDSLQQVSNVQPTKTLNVVVPPVVPEPASASLLVAGLVGVLLLRRRS